MITIWTLLTVLTKFIQYFQSWTFRDYKKKKRSKLWTMPKTIIITHNCHTHTLGSFIMTCKETYCIQGTWKNEMWTLLSSNFHFTISYGWLLKCLQYKTPTSGTYTIMYLISTLKKWVINTYVVYKKCFYMGEKMTAVNKHS
jgi:hypothetical protein